jgi:hypothetical protein
VPVATVDEVLRLALVRTPEPLTEDEPVAPPPPADAVTTGTALPLN